MSGCNDLLPNNGTIEEQDADYLSSKERLSSMMGSKLTDPTDTITSETLVDPANYDDSELDSWNDANDRFISEKFEQLHTEESDVQENDVEKRLLNSSRLKKQLSKILSNELELHEAVFKNDMVRIFEILRGIEAADESYKREIVNKKDKHGNTPLHLACMLGRSKDIVSALIDAGALGEVKNLNKWTPFHEACSYGNRDIISLMTVQLRKSVHDSLHNENLADKLEKTRNYRMVLRWEFQSWIPFISRYLPNDLCVINKQGRFIRIDTKITHWETLSWQTGNGSFIYSNRYPKKWVFMDHEVQKFVYFEPDVFSRDTNCKIDEFMSLDIMDIELKSSDIQMTRSTKGWFWKSDKVEKIGSYNASLYNFNNVFLVTRKRREHLSNNDIKRNKVLYKAFLQVLQNGPRDEAAALLELPENEGVLEAMQDGHRPSLEPPPPTNITWEEYLDFEPGTHPSLGRPHVIKVVKNAFKASVAISEEFPLSKSQFIDLLSVVPLKLFKKLKDFIDLRLPDGFPIRLDVPLLPFLSARVTFEDFSFKDGPIEEHLFSVPPDYKEDKELLQRLMRNRRPAAQS